MIKKEKVFELKIEDDDELSGIDSISLVDEPAIEVMWVAFSKEKEHEFHIPDNEDDIYLDRLLSKGQPEQELLDEGWEIERIETVKENFATSPNAVSSEDNEFYRVRYKYALNSNIRQSAIIATTRQFCKQLINKNYVWRIEEIESEVNSFGQSAQFWRGGYNCRHQWYRIFYKRRGDITNKASASKSKIEVAGFPVELSPEWIQPDTVTSKTAANPSPSTVRNLGLKKEEMGYDNAVPSYVDELPKKKKKKLKDEDELIEKGLVPPTTFLDAFEYLNPSSFSKQHFQISSDEEYKKIVLGPAMIPYQKIFRKDELGNPYYVFFSAETIKMIAEKYMRNKLIDNNDQMHDGKAIKDIHVLESWIKESDNDKSTDYGYGELPVGTWFVSMKVNNSDIWEKVKSKKLNGFSVSGFFSEEAAFSKEEMFLYQVAEILKKY